MIGQNTEESPGDFWRLAVTQTPVKNHLLTLLRKTLKGIAITVKALTRLGGKDDPLETERK